MEWLFILSCALGVLMSLAMLQQVWMAYQGRGIRGPGLVPPFVGNIVAMVMTPWNFYIQQEKLGKLSWNSFLGLFVLFSKDTDITRFVLNLPTNFQAFLTAGAKKVLGENNIIFLDGEPHKTLRRQLVPLFQPRALGIYVRHQERIIRKHIAQWVSTPGEQVMQVLARDLSMETSQDIFCGPYLTPELRTQLRDLYWQMNEGFLCLPVCLPGTTLWKAREARLTVVKMLAGFASASRNAAEGRKAAGKEVGCLLDVWMEVEKETNEQMPDVDIGHHLLGFLFASQDATTSAMVWIVIQLHAHPEWRQRLIAEQDHLLPNDEPVDSELISKMDETFMFVKEVLRYRPPATMVPMKAIKDTKLDDGYVIPKGAVVLPSIWSATKEGYPLADEFEPERFGKERDEGAKYAKHFLVFGHGPHKCLGQHYAMNHLMAFTAVLVKSANWERIRKKGADEIIFLPTIFPGDKGVFTLTARNPIAKTV